MNKAFVLYLVGRLLLLLPLLFFAWYQLLPSIVPMLADLLDPLLRLLWPTSFVKVQAAGAKVAVIARLAAEAAAPGQPYKGVLLNPFTYSYGMPLFAALALATEATWRQQIARLLLGLGLLTVGLCVSIVASLLFMYQFDTGFERLELLSSREANDALVRYVHFLGFLILPRALPLALWILLYRDSLARLIRTSPADAARSGATEEKGGSA